MLLKDYLSQFPMPVLTKTRIRSQQITLPAVIDADDFNTLFSTEIHDSTFTSEKAIYVAAQHEPKPMKTISQLLNEKH